MEVSESTERLLTAIKDLPPELIEVITNGSNTQYLDVITSIAGNSRYTDRIVTTSNSLLVEIITRWTKRHQTDDSIPLFGRILQNAPYLAELIHDHLSGCSSDGYISLTERYEDEEHLFETLLGLHRLLVFDVRAFRTRIRLSDLQTCLSHQSRPIRYLAIRCLSLFMGIADAAVQKSIEIHLGSEAISGHWEGKTIDYRFFSLWEERRYMDLAAALQEPRIKPEKSDVPVRRILSHEWSPATTEIEGVLLPGSSRESKEEQRDHLVHIETTSDNLRRFADALLRSDPVLIEGPPGSGKTLLINHVAMRLNKLDKMVTLHLNEQSDAKLLIGMYTTGSTPGTFSWQPGVLTTAVSEGRWVLIEDIDRGPNEVISTLLPLIEKQELSIPSRGEDLKAAPGFRLIATTSTTADLHGKSISRSTNMLGLRMWSRVQVHSMRRSELRTVIEKLHPLLQDHTSTILAVYNSLLDLEASRSFAAQMKAISARLITPRELLKWCERLATSFARSSRYTDTTINHCFLDAVDCFAASIPPSIPPSSVRDDITAAIAKELQIDEVRRDRLLTRPAEDTGFRKRNNGVHVGRALLERQSTLRPKNPSQRARPFAYNGYSLKLLEQVAVAVDAHEPLLLVGETGTGKTTVVQHLADQLGRKLVSFNLSQQSESGDLLGGFKPVNVRTIMMPLKDEFDDLFARTFGHKKNQSFVDMLGKYFAKGKWKQVCKMWRGALSMVEELRKLPDSPAASPAGSHRSKRQKTETSRSSQIPEALEPRWLRFTDDVERLEAQLSRGSDALAFAFVEGSIVKAVRNGDWVLLDEINLASQDTLEACADLFNGGKDAARSILLTDTGNVERVQAHKDFRIFAAMNPATDVGKKDLPGAIRSRFTEIYVPSPDQDRQSLQSIVTSYLNKTNNSELDKVALDVTKLYQEIQKLSGSNALVDGAGQRPHYSLRTLTRVLVYALDMSPFCTLRKALLEGFHMSFCTLLDSHSDSVLSPIIWNHLYSRHANVRAELSRPLKKPEDGRQYIQMGEHWLRQGDSPLTTQPHYIITPSIQRNLKNLIRAASTRRFPILIQGPTSSGKTSMIEYMANVSGNTFVRINNHEHTDLQEYLGTYVSNTDGALEFQEGVLVKALREGHWVVLDELNLAPSDVLEALNRLLDDNRELLIPETQEVVRPHEKFMLFATQNPAGLYGGRKVLSRAFRNRFLELNFEDIPVQELQEILEKRTMIPKSWCGHIVGVYKELSSLRQETRMFEQKSFATLRDLFRWAQRDANSKQELAINGFMLLAERARKPEERKAVAEVIEKTMNLQKPNVHIDADELYNMDALQSIPKLGGINGTGMVWTSAMRRLFILVYRALQNNEPVLLVGETGCGKTTVCQMLAAASNRRLHIVNAHQNTETGDLIGAQRPIRNRSILEQQLTEELLAVLNVPLDTSATSRPPLEQLLQKFDQLVADSPNLVSTTQNQLIKQLRQRCAALFEWSDGALVEAMKTGDHFLLDEISLADDSVLERLNSVLESQRTLLLAEKGSIDSQVAAVDGFQFLATMNPGGDFGKRELSPALRNRFTEIWVPPISNLIDVVQIVRSKLQPLLVNYAEPLVAFAQWFTARYDASAASSISIRDILAWIEFANRFAQHDPIAALTHGAAMVYVDSLGANPAAILSISLTDLDTERRICLEELSRHIKADAVSAYALAPEVILSNDYLRIAPFSVEVVSTPMLHDSFSMNAPTTSRNAMRILRALQLPKPILLEGSPGVGKTTLVAAIAAATGRHLERINLSEQTDLMDLFGSDAPVEGEQAGRFQWKDGPFLAAMKQGDWVLLDEMNLASQSVLEGLNACLDHRGEVYIAELDQTFQRHPNFRLFAAQNPHHQGGGRKGLPASFVNRFTVVYADVFKADDLLMICKKSFPQAGLDQIHAIGALVDELQKETSRSQIFGSQGSPWEFNLRDMLRWLTLSQSPRSLLESASAYDLTDIIFRSRFRNVSDRSNVDRLFEKHFPNCRRERNFFHNLDESSYQVGISCIRRSQSVTQGPASYFQVTVEHLPIFETINVCVQKAWPVILVGSSNSGKTTLLEQISSFAGAKLTVLPLHADIDATDLIGGFEQVDLSREYRVILQSTWQLIRDWVVAASCNVEHDRTSSDIFGALDSIQRLSETTAAGEVLLTLQNLLQQIQLAHGIDTENLASKCDLLLSASKQAQESRFRWVDGSLIKAIQEGHWLVLDNANLCSSSVLDRLNSLLEPSGFMSIGENPDAGGQARVIRPHPEFRVFMTMDPRHGELSRAMRNRAIEVYVELHDSNRSGSSPVTFITDSSMSHFRNFSLVDKLEETSTLAPLSDIVCDHLSFSDIRRAEAFQEQMLLGLYNAPQTFGTSLQHLQSFPAELASQVYDLYLTYVSKLKASYIGSNTQVSAPFRLMLYS